MLWLLPELEFEFLMLNLFAESEVNLFAKSEVIGGSGHKIFLFGVE